MRVTRFHRLKKQKGSTKILNPIAKERKSILDFCYILQNQGSVPLKKWLLENGKVQEKCGLVNIDNTKGMFALFYNESGDLNYKGIIQNEEANQVSVSSVPNDEK